MTSATMRRTQAIGIRLVILLLLFLFVYGNADGQQGQAGPKSGGTLSISIGVDPNHLDPAAINATQGVNITQLVAQPLTTYVNSTGQLEPLLATSWTSTPDLRSWTFTLRSGVKFTDGTPFNADAVKKNFDRLIDPRINAPALNDLRYIKSTEVVDEHHVTVHLSQPIAFLPSIVTNTVGAITSPASWTVGGNTYQLAERIVGTGPYTKDNLAFFPLIYWPMDPREKDLTPETISKLSEYMRNGGTILFDTRDLSLGPVRGPNSPGEQTLRRLLSKLDIPPLQPVPPDHVLTKAFYLLQSFPGRWDGGKVWVEALPPRDPDAGPEPARGGDGVSPVIIGGNDWAAAWAVDSTGQPIMAAVPGGAEQREMAFRFGVNVVMYALTGNYKTDQVHVPALLERSGK